jgi:8-oxo-dGTP diphosphatase
MGLRRDFFAPLFRGTAWMSNSVAKKASAWAVVMNLTGEVLVGKRSARVNNPDQWNFFGGGIKRGENPLLAAVRELAEETGIRVAADQVSHQGCVDTDSRTISFFVFPVLFALPALNREHTAFRWCALGDLMDEPALHRPTAIILNSGLLIPRSLHGLARLDHRSAGLRV